MSNTSAASGSTSMVETNTTGGNCSSVGTCCSECADLQCNGVVCDGPTACEAGYVFKRPDGACCADCVPDPETVVCADDGECLLEVHCALGYVAGDLVGGCCDDCLPDPLYCLEDSDCTLANRPRTCCGCDEVISTRALDDDPCWVPVGEPRDIPEECYSEATCDAPCGACPEAGPVACVGYRCRQLPLP